MSGASFTFKMSVTLGLFAALSTLNESWADRQRRDVFVYMGGGDVSKLDPDLQKDSERQSNADPSLRPAEFRQTAENFATFYKNNSSPSRELQVLYGTSQDRVPNRMLFGVESKPFTQNDVSHGIATMIQRIDRGEITSGDQMMVWVNAHRSIPSTGEGQGRNKEGQGRSKEGQGRSKEGQGSSKEGQGSSKEGQGKSKEGQGITGVSDRWLSADAKSEIDLELIRTLKNKCKEKGILLALVDLSCESATSLALADPNTCVISSSTSDFMATRHFAEALSTELSHSNNLDEAFTRAIQSPHNGFPRISSNVGMTAFNDVNPESLLIRPKNPISPFEYSEGTIVDQVIGSRVPTSALSQKYYSPTCSMEVSTDSFTQLYKTIQQTEPATGYIYPLRPTLLEDAQTFSNRMDLYYGERTGFSLKENPSTQRQTEYQNASDQLNLSGHKFEKDWTALYLKRHTYYRSIYGEQDDPCLKFKLKNSP